MKSTSDAVSQVIGTLRMISLVSIFVIEIIGSVFGLFPAMSELSFHSIVVSNNNVYKP